MVIPPNARNRLERGSAIPQTICVLQLPCPFAYRFGPSRHVAASFQQVLTFGGEPDSAADAVEEE
jgi:hypothetical protein